MRLNRIGVVAGKEFKDVLRDRRTLFFMLLLPIAVMPLLMLGVSKFSKSQLKAKEKRVLTVAVAPQQRVLLTSLADRWWKDNVFNLVALSARIGVEQLGGLSDLERLTERVETLQQLGRSRGIGDTALLAWFQAYRDFDDRQKQMLKDGAVVHHLLKRMDWRDIATVAADGELPPGVDIPEDLPGELADPRISLAITNQDKDIHAALHVPIDIYERLERGAVSVPITMLYDGSQSLSQEAADRVIGFLDTLSRSEMRLRLTAAELSPGFVQPFDLRSANVASPSREVQAIVGSVLPYLIILFCFFGAFYPSLDLTAGEKERFTLETLLLAPVARLEIAAGKFLVVFAAAVIAAIVATTSMALTFTYGILPEGATQAFALEFEPLALLLTTSLLIPVAALFSALLLGVALLARSFKEAQSYAAPLQFLVILPAISALMPDLETELHWAWVPLMNVSLLMKELLKGNYLWDFYAITQGSMLVLTVLVLWGASLLFRRESVLLRT